MHPIIAAVPRTANPPRGGPSTAASPPWAPAPEPERPSGPYPVAAAGPGTPPPGAGLRVPGDVPGPLAFTTQPPAPATPAAAGPATGPHITETATGPHVTGPPTGPQILGPPTGPHATGPGTGPQITETATGPDVTETPTDPDITRTAGRSGAAGPAYGPDTPTRQSLDFAAAPVATSYPGPAWPAEDDTIVYPGSGPVTDPNSVWDLAATDVFPVAGPQAPDDEAPGASLR
jgi:hypothetical protein